MSNQQSTRHKPHHGHRRPPPSRGVSWCCSFAVPPGSPLDPNPTPKPTSAAPKSAAASYPNSPHRVNLVNRILSPGRVSPIDPDPIPTPSPTPMPLQEIRATQKSSPQIADTIKTHFKSECSVKSKSNSGLKQEENLGGFDVRLNLRGKRGGSLVLELNSGVLTANSSFFGDLIATYRRDPISSSGNFVRVEVPEVDSLSVFRETIELMFEEGEEGITKKLLKFGVYRCIDILEVTASIKFARGTSSCLKYLEAVPWSEKEEEKMRSLFDRFTFGEAISRDILSRLSSLDSESTQLNLTKQLVWSITSSTDATARNELKSLVKALLQTSSVYEWTHADIEKDDLYAVCRSCLESLVILFEEASVSNSSEKMAKKDSNKPLVECISKQVDNIYWVLEILLDRQNAEEFVNIWAEQKELLIMHEGTSPMVRYELSRISAMLFISIGTGKLHCRSEARLSLLKAWFSPMLLDFGWLRRCRKGLGMKTLEESMGQALLTLPLKHQYNLFMEWFQCFSKHGNDCPNLSKAFQIWWRRSFLRGSETHATESR